MRQFFLYLALGAGIALAQTPTPTPVTNQPPLVFTDVVPDPLGDGAWVVCSVHDDGTYLRFAWTKVSGPLNGSVIWSSQTGRTAHVSFTVKGLYVLRCTVNDGTNFVSDELRIEAADYADAAVRVR
jgi:hypothetical protein